MVNYSGEVETMHKKIIGILVCMLLVGTVLPVTGQVSKNIIIKNPVEIKSPLLNNDKWTKTLNLKYEDGGSSVQQTPDGGYIIVGGTCEKSSPDREYWDYWLIKTDSKGNILWDKIFGGEKDDAAQMIKLTSDGGYIITGATESYGAGENDVWLIKTDSNGNMMWNKTFGDIYQDFGEDIEQTDDGGYIIVGSKGVSEAQKDDAWLIKTDEFGNIVWNRTYGSSGIDNGYSVVKTLDGGYVVTGFTSKEGTWDVWLFKTDSEGEMLWEKIFVSDTYAISYSVELTDDGGYILTGWDPYYHPDANAFLIKTDSEGELLWRKTFGEGYEYIGSMVAQTSDGGYIIIGIRGLIFSSEEGTDGFLIKTDSDGEKEWIKFYGNRLYSDVVGRGHQTTDGGYILVGWAWKHIIPWPFYDNQADLLLIKTDSNGNAPPVTKNIRYKSNLLGNRPLINRILLRFLEKFPNSFPILRHLLRL